MSPSSHPDAATPCARAAVHVVSRVAAALAGGYALVWGAVALIITLGTALGLDFHTAETLANLLAFPFYLAALLWAFAAASLARVWMVLLGGGAAASGAAWLLQLVVL